jgi:hypothetical protein
VRTFQRWYAYGIKFAIITGGGSIYALLLVAGLDLRHQVSCLIGRAAWEVAKMLRRPETAGESFFGSSERKYADGSNLKNHT